MNSCYEAADPISRLQRLEDFPLVLPGPMAQAFTFRAFGAATRRFSISLGTTGLIAGEIVPEGQSWI